MVLFHYTISHIIAMIAETRIGRMYAVADPICLYVDASLGNCNIMAFSIVLLFQLPLRLVPSAVTMEREIERQMDGRTM